MASLFPERRRGHWIVKYKPSPHGPEVRVMVGKDARLKGLAADRQTPKPPTLVAARFAELTAIEENARLGLKDAAAVMTLAAYAAKYLDAFSKSRKSGSVRQASRHLERFVAFASARGVGTIQEVTRQLCRDYLELRITQVSHDTLKTEVGYLSPLWSRAEDDELIPRNPWKRLMVPGKSTKREGTAWTSEEVARIARCCSKRWQSDLVAILANTGLRIRTALRLRWEWIDFERGEITIPASEAAASDGIKTAYTHRLSPFVLAKLREIQTGTEGPLVFPSPKTADLVSYDTANNAIASAIRRAGVRPGKTHDLRRTYATLLLDACKDIHFVSKQLGHSSITTTEIYLSAAGRRFDSEAITGFSVGDSQT